MKPILCDPSKTLTQLVNDYSNGIGRINALKADVIEERNGLYELELTVFVDDEHFKDIQAGSILKAKAGDLAGLQLFRVYQITKPISGVCQVYAHHITYDLCKAPVMPFQASSAAATMAGLKTNLGASYEFDMYTDIQNSSSTFKLAVPKYLRECLGGYAGSVLDVYGGEYEFDNLTVKLLTHRGSDNGVRIAYGKNLTNIEQETNIESMYTAAVGFVSIDDSTVTGDIQYIVQGVAPKVKIIDFSNEYDELPTKAQINARTQAYINANQLNVPKVSIDVSFVALSQTDQYRNIAPLERVSLCDTVHVYFEKLGVNASAKVIRTEYDVLNERLTAVELGDSRTSVFQSIQEDLEAVEDEITDSVSMMEHAITHATDLITGGLGGYVVIGRNANGEPEEILIMDNPDKANAVNVIRFNKNGIGFSTHGYNGPYANAWTIDGKLVADFITSGTLNANLIRAGIISDVGGLNYWNLANGEFRLTTGAYLGTGSDTIGGVLQDMDGDISNAATAASNAATAVSNLDSSLNQQGVFNRLTRNGAAQGIYLQSGNLYINASYIQTGTLSANRINGGTLTLGGSNNTNGTMNVKDSGGTVSGKWDNDGIKIYSNSSLNEYLKINDSSIQLIKSGTVYGGLELSQWQGKTSAELTASDCIYIGSDGYLVLDADDKIQITVLDIGALTFDSVYGVKLSATNYNDLTIEGGINPVIITGNDLKIESIDVWIWGNQTVTGAFEDAWGNTYGILNGMIVY